MNRTATRKNTTPRRRKQQRRVIRLDRLAFVLGIFAAIVLLIIFIISRACTDDEITKEPPQTPTSVITTATHDAASVAATAPESMERQNALLSIHARESELRLNGYVHAAEEYHNEVIHQLEKHGIEY